MDVILRMSNKDDDDSKFPDHQEDEVAYLIQYDFIDNADLFRNCLFPKSAFDGFFWLMIKLCSIKF